MTAVTDWDIAELLPHTGAMVLLDRVVSFEEDHLSAAITVRGNGLLFGDERSVPAWAALEYMAQAIGAYVGLQAKQAGQPIRLGFLLGSRLLQSNVGTLPVGCELAVTVEKIVQDEQLGVFDCRVSGDNIEISAKLNVYQPRSDQSLPDE
ncbi:3-hydroxylacyl-ACP dehydratase [Methylomonas sp. SURF-1]|uniref:3-hydroxylacyl-ACP dehydratase n=1 Tax=Methylomonas aurea TaxID=2952224 RepID=A0ABT1UJB2_9GAMM|nr:3-hydroxylacyl-ACP dehydratase [Methylomonas sp. SURF-1]MCQ8181774.1 3-hydroxylacyl-ACP dehydratase [Methylomonas sp. SURF-1]